jgi:tetratricopeptide (TPR) repeat protein
MRNHIHRPPRRRPARALAAALLRLATAALACSAATLHTAQAAEDSMTREQALQGLQRPDARARLAAVERLAEIGRMPDADRLVASLRDSAPEVRESAQQAMWRIWSRSGDPAIDRQFAQGLAHMQAQAFDRALAVFDGIVQRMPAFAEGWNKRATLYFLLGEHEKSLKDCDEVLKRNPNHFGALSGAGQIHLQLGNPEQALAFFKRALQVNPNLAENLGPAIELLEQQLRKGRTTT